MRRPLLVAVDADLEALADVQGALVRRYGRDYRVEALGDAGRSGERLAAAVGEGSVAVHQIHDILTNRRLHPARERAAAVPATAALHAG